MCSGLDEHPNFCPFVLDLNSCDPCQGKVNLEILPLPQRQGPVRTIAKTVYCGYILQCPKCGRGGSLHATYTRNVHSMRWSGPHFRVYHAKYIYCAKLYRERRDKGIPWSVRHHSGKNKASYARCYLGKVCPA